MWIRILLKFVAVCLLAGPVLAQDYIVGGGDLLRVSVWDVPKLSVDVVVRPDGKITLPAVGDVVAAGMTPTRLANEIKKVLGKVVKKPMVTLTVVEVTNNRIYVAGGGVPSQVVAVPNQITLFQFLCRFDSFAETDLQRAFVMRGDKRIKSNFEGLFLGGNFSEDIQLEPDDVVFLPNIRDNKVYVVGAVNEPKYVYYRSGLKVLDAILEAGGFNEFADVGDVVIIRQQILSDGKINKFELQADIKALLKGKDLRQNIFLKPGDYVNVKEGLF